MKLGDRSVKVLLATAVVLLAANLFVQLLPAVRPALAGGIPDSGAQLDTLIGEVQKLNKTVEKVQSTLESGDLTVKVKDAKSEK